MKTLFSLLIFCSSFSLLAQSGGSPWSLEFYYSPQYFNFRSTVLKNTNSLFKPAYSYTTGLAVDCRLSERWSVNGGLAFQNLQERIDFSDLRWGSQHDGNGGFDPTIVPGEPNIRSISYYYQLEMPLSTKYYLNTTGRTQFYLRGGLQPEWRMGYNNVTIKAVNSSLDQESERVESFSKQRIFNVSVLLGAGMELRLKNRIALFFEPEAKTTLFSFNSLSTALSARNNKHVFGLRVGAKLNFAERN